MNDREKRAEAYAEVHHPRLRYQSKEEAQKDALLMYHAIAESEAPFIEAMVREEVWRRLLEELCEDGKVHLTEAELYKIIRGGSGE